MTKSWVMMMHQTNNKHKEKEEARSTSEVQHAERSGLNGFYPTHSIAKNVGCFQWHLFVLSWMCLCVCFST